MNDEHVSRDKRPRSTFFATRIVWSAIVAGLVVALVSQILFTILGIAIGAAKITPVSDPDGFGFGAAMWWILTSLVSLFIGAMVAGRLSGATNKRDGAMHGFLMWSAATVLTFLVAGTVLGGLSGGALGALGSYGSHGSAAYYRAQNEMTLRNPPHHRNNSPTSNVDLRTDQATSYEDRVSPPPSGSGIDTTSKVINKRGTTSSTPNQIDTSRAQSTASDTASMGATSNRTSTESQSEEYSDVSKLDQSGVGSQQDMGARGLGDDVDRLGSMTAKAALWALLGLFIGASVSIFGGSRIGDHDVAPRVEPSTMEQ